MSEVKFLVGADPEVFVRDRDGNLVNAHGMIPGTKDDPHPVNGGAVQVDGMALEFNINPASSFEEFEDNILTVLSELEKMIPNGYSLDFSPVANFGEDYIKSQPEISRVLGCNPDFNASTGLQNPIPNAGLGFRTASGHIHVGWTKDQDINHPEHIEACKMAVKQLDAVLGIPSKIWDKDVVRSSMYGKMSAYRPKSYGVEYRTLSNTWVNDRTRRKFIYDATIWAMERLLIGRRYYENLSMVSFQEAFESKNQYLINDYTSYARSLVPAALRNLLTRIENEIKNPESGKYNIVNGLKADLMILNDIIYEEAAIPVALGE